MHTASCIAERVQKFKDAINCGFSNSTGIGKKAWPFAKLEPGRARKRINAT